MSNHHFFAYLYRLREIQRWGLMRKTQQDNVVEHSYYVSILAHMLCTIANEVFAKQVPTERIVLLCLMHDIEEVITGDPPSTVKHANVEILTNYRNLERLAASRLFNQIPKELQHVYRPLILEPDPELLKWVKAADILDAYLKCLAELAAGNREFTVAKVQNENKLEALHMPEIDYFLVHFAPSLEKTLDEIS